MSGGNYTTIDNQKISGSVPVIFHSATFGRRESWREMSEKIGISE